MPPSKNKRSMPLRMTKALRKQDIVKKAKVVFARQGFQKTSIGDILKACKVAQGTLYLHFDGKTALFKEVVAGALERVLKIISPLEGSAVPGAQPNEFDLHQYIYRKNQKLFEAVRAEKNLFRIILLESPGVDPEINKILDHILGIVKNQVATELALFRRMNLLNDIDLDVAVQTVVGATIMILKDNFFGDSEPDTAHLAEQLTRLLLFGYSRNHPKRAQG